MRSVSFLCFALVGCMQSAEYAPNDEVETNGHTQDTLSEDTDTLNQFSVVEGVTEVEMMPAELTLGLETDDQDYDAFHTTHMVELSHEWSIMKTEVTHEMWEALMPYSLRTSDETVNDLGCDDCPARDVSWHEAQAFANAMSDVAGLEQCFTCEGDGPDVRCEAIVDPYDCEGFRLPTEAEWEYAARGGEDYVYPGSNDIDDIAYWVENSNDVPYPVMSKAPNGFGLYDMGGNIRERVYDAYEAYTPEDKIDPVAMPDFDPGEPEIYSERGGSYACRRPEIRWNRRNMVWSYTRDIHTGFRLARILD